MKSAIDDPPQKVEGEAGVGLRERPLAASQLCSHAAVLYHRTGRSFCSPLSLPINIARAG